MEYRELMHKLIELCVLHRYSVGQKASAAGLYRGQPPLLDYLLKNGESAQKDIAEHLHVSPASVAVSIRRMEKNGLVTKVCDESDLRRNRISITEKGIRVLHDFHSFCLDLDRKMFSGISEPELVQLEDFLNRMTENLLDGRDRSVVKQALEMERCANSEGKGKRV